MKKTTITCDICKGSHQKFEHSQFMKSLIAAGNAVPDDPSFSARVSRDGKTSQEIDLCKKCFMRIKDSGISRLVKEDRVYA